MFGDVRVLRGSLDLHLILAMELPVYVYDYFYEMCVLLYPQFVERSLGISTLISIHSLIHGFLRIRMHIRVRIITSRQAM